MEWKNKKKIHKEYMNKRQWKKILETSPIVCVELVFKNNGKYLFIKRKQKPDKGLYAIPGGTILRGETILEALKRKAQEEVGISIKEYKFRGIEMFYGNESEVGTDYYAVSLIYEIPTKCYTDKAEDKWLKVPDNTVAKYSKKIISIVENGMEK